MHPARPGEHVLDVETLWLSWDAPERGDDKAWLRVSCCVVQDIGTRRTLVFAAEKGKGWRPLEDLYRFLEACRSDGCTLVGHNLRSFDWEVLAGEFAARGLVADARAWGPGAARLVDTLASLHAKIGWRPSLQVLAWHNLREVKSMDGALAPAMWRQGLRSQVVAYCRRDVELTARVWRKGREEGKVAVGMLADGTPDFVSVEW